jgi:hypothetical protein
MATILVDAMYLHRPWYRGLQSIKCLHPHPSSYSPLFSMTTLRHEYCSVQLALCVESSDYSESSFHSRRSNFYFCSRWRLADARPSALRLPATFRWNTGTISERSMERRFLMDDESQIFCSELCNDGFLCVWRVRHVTTYKKPLVFSRAYISIPKLSSLSKVVVEILARTLRWKSLLVSRSYILFLHNSRVAQWLQDMYILLYVK